MLFFFFPFLSAAQDCEGQKYGYTKNSCQPVVLSRGRHHSTGEKTKRIAGVIFILQKIQGVFAYIPASR